MNTSISTLKKDPRNEQEELIHNLLPQEIRPIANLHEFFIRWQAAKTYEEMLGLLHHGFNISLQRYGLDEKEYDEIDRLVFYFTIADGWYDHRLLKLPKDKDFYVCIKGKMGTMSQYTFRQELAKKALNMLCLNFFNAKLIKEVWRGRKTFNPEWGNTIVSKRLFPVIQNFFRIQRSMLFDKKEIRNLPQKEKLSHNEKEVVSFIINLATFVWEWEKENEPPYWDLEIEKQCIKMYSRLNSFKPWLIEVLSFLGQISLLEKWTLELDEACLVKLEKIALRNKLSRFNHPVTEDRQVTTIEEACYIGSPAAWFLTKHNLTTKNHERLVAIQEAEQRKEVAEQELGDLKTAGSKQ
jgi:hypothetical protein